jgi:hypothetical protein
LSFPQGICVSKPATKSCHLDRSIAALSDAQRRDPHFRPGTPVFFIIPAGNPRLLLLLAVVAANGNGLR